MPYLGLFGLQFQKTIPKKIWTTIWKYVQKRLSWWAGIEERKWGAL